MASPDYGAAPRNGVPYFIGDTLIADGDAASLALATWMDSNVICYSAGLLSARPASGTGVDNRVYRATDENILYYDNGTTWVQLTPSAWSAITATTGMSNLGSNMGYSGVPEARYDVGGVIRLRGTLRNVAGHTITAGTVLGNLVLGPAALSPVSKRVGGVTVVTSSVPAGVAALLTMAPGGGGGVGAPLRLNIDLTINGEVPLDHLSFPRL